MFYGYILERLAIVSKYSFPVPVTYVSAALLMPEVIKKVKGEKGYIYYAEAADAGQPNLVCNRISEKLRNSITKSANPLLSPKVNDGRYASMTMRLEAQRSCSKVSLGHFRNLEKQRLGISRFPLSS